MLYGLQSAKTRLRVKIFKIGFLAQNSSLGLVDDAQSENIGEKQEYIPKDWIYNRGVRNHGFRTRSLSYKVICK